MRNGVCDANVSRLGVLAIQQTFAFLRLLARNPRGFPPGGRCEKRQQRHHSGARVGRRGGGQPALAKPAEVERCVRRPFAVAASAEAAPSFPCMKSSAIAHRIWHGTCAVAGRGQTPPPDDPGGRPTIPDPQGRPSCSSGCGGDGGRLLPLLPTGRPTGRPVAAAAGNSGSGAQVGGLSP